MAFPDALEVCRQDLFSPVDELTRSYPPVIVRKVERVRAMYLWQIANPDRKDAEFVREDMTRHPDITRPTAYDDLKIIKAILPNLAKASRDFHRWRFVEMILETYSMAKSRKDTKTMEKAAATYAKYTGCDKEDDNARAEDLYEVQPFIATEDPTVLGIAPIPNVHEKIKAMLDKYRSESMDIEDVDFEAVDLEEDELFSMLDDDVDDNEETDEGEA